MFFIEQIWIENGSAEFEKIINRNSTAPHQEMVNCTNFSNTRASTPSTWSNLTALKSNLSQALSSHTIVHTFPCPKSKIGHSNFDQPYPQRKCCHSNQRVAPNEGPTPPLSFSNILTIDQIQRLRSCEQFNSPTPSFCRFSKTSFLDLQRKKR